MPLRLALLDAVTRDMSYITSKITPGKMSPSTSPDGTNDSRLEAWLSSQTVALSQPPNAIPAPGAEVQAGPIRPGLQRSQTTLTRTSSATQRVYESRMSSDFSVHRNSSRRNRDSLNRTAPSAAQIHDFEPAQGDVQRSKSITVRPTAGRSYRSHDASMLSRQSTDDRRISGDSRASGGRSPGAAGSAAGLGMWAVPIYTKQSRRK